MFSRSNLCLDLQNDFAACALALRKLMGFFTSVSGKIASMCIINLPSSISRFRRRFDFAGHHHFFADLFGFRLQMPPSFSRIADNITLTLSS
jgi:hypothetical protein